jgi:hypothetical protein
MRIQRRSKKRRAADAARSYLKFDAIRRTAKRATKAPTPVKALPVVAGVGVAGAVAARKRRQQDETPPTADAPSEDQRQATAA